MSTVSNLVTKVIKFIQYLFICIKQNLGAAFSNRTSFVLQTALMALNNITWLIVWIILFSKSNGNINGITMKDILYLWSLPVISFGLTFFVFGGIEYISQNIVTGNLDLYLTQPKFSLIGLITSKSKLSACGDLVYGLILGLFATDFSILNYLFLITLSIIACIAMSALLIIIQCFAFWIGDITTAATTYIGSLYVTLTIYPKEMYNTFTKIIIYTIVPTFYTTYLPVSICTTFSFPKLIFFLFTTTILVLLCLLIYTQGLKKYESSNSFNLKY